jgi:hypothetical protein
MSKPNDPYRKQRGPIRVHYIGPPIPTQAFDWCAYRPDSYDGAPDSGPIARLQGYGPTECLAIEDLILQESEYFEPDDATQVITPEQTGASAVACEIINATFLSLDGFEPLRRQMDKSPDYMAVHFAASLARVVDRVLAEHKVTAQ